MTERIEISIEGPLDSGIKWKVLAAAQEAFSTWATEFNEEHKTALTVAVRPVQAPRKKKTPDQATGTLTQEVAEELAAQPEAPTPITTHRGRGTHQAEAAE
jgi:hypothetical protein